MKIYKKILGFFALAVLLNPNTLTLDASTFSKEDQIYRCLFFKYN